MAVTGPAASAIAGDMASRLAEQIGPARAATTIKLEKDTSEFATALEAALKGWGYTVVTDGKTAKDVKVVELAYAIEGFDGQVLVRVSMHSITLGRAYTPTAAGATPASPLSIMQRNCRRRRDWSIAAGAFLQSWRHRERFQQPCDQFRRPA